MFQLLLDSSNQYLSIGLAKNGELIDSIFYEAWQRQSEMMVVEIDNIMKRNSCSKCDIDSVIIGIGPGSYTGVRIGLTIAKTIAYASKAKLYAVSSLFILKDNDNPSICVINARSGRSYFAVYHGDKALVSDSIMTNEEVLSYIASHPDYSLCGEVNHLGLAAKNSDLIRGLLDGLNEKYLVDNVLGLKPVYLKDLYDDKSR